MQAYKHEDPTTKLVIKATHKVTRVAGMVVLLAGEPAYEIDETEFDLEISQDPLDAPVPEAPPPTDAPPNSSGSGSTDGQNAATLNTLQQGAASVPADLTPEQLAAIDAAKQATEQSPPASNPFEPPATPIVDAGTDSPNESVPPAAPMTDAELEQVADANAAEAQPAAPDAEVQSTPPAAPVDDVAPAAAG